MTQTNGGGRGSHLIFRATGPRWPCFSIADKRIGITPGKLWNCSWHLCDIRDIDPMNIYNIWIIHSAIKWGTSWREGVRLLSAAVLSKEIQTNRIFFSNTKCCRFILHGGNMADVLLHNHITTTCHGADVPNLTTNKVIVSFTEQEIRIHDAWHNMWCIWICTITAWPPCNWRQGSRLALLCTCLAVKQLRLWPGLTCW